MINYFDRVCQVVIESVKRIDIADNKIRFEITKSINAGENIGRIEIWNLTPEIRKMIHSTDSLVRVFAGYAQHSGLIELAQGDIINVRHNRSKCDIVTQIYIGDGNKNLRQKPISKGFEGEVRLSEIIATFQEQSGVPFRCVGVSKSAVVSGGYSICGGLASSLDDLCLVFGLNWSLQDGTILITGQEDEQQETILLLTPETGLIINPETVKQVSEKLVDSDEPLPPCVYSVQSLIQPQLKVNDLIAVKSPSLDGVFRIQKITHTGDTRGNDWYSSMEVLAA